MGGTFASNEWKAEEGAGRRSQAGLALIGEVSDYQHLPVSLIQQMTLNGSLNEAARHLGLEDQQIAEAMHISGGYMSKFMRGVWAAWARRTILFMRTNRSLVPLQKIADEMGCDVVPRSSSAARIRELEDEIARVKGKRS